MTYCPLYVIYVMLSVRDTRGCGFNAACDGRATATLTLLLQQPRPLHCRTPSASAAEILHIFVNFKGLPFGH